MVSYPNGSWDSGEFAWTEPPSWEERTEPYEGEQLFCQIYRPPNGARYEKETRNIDDEW